MISRTAILDKLATLDSSGVSRDAPVTVSIQGSHGSFHATAIAIEKLAGVFTDIGYRMPGEQALPAERLHAVGDILAQRLQYLMEPIAPVEFDGEAAVLQLRSVPPSQEDSHTRSYYEVLVRPQEISLRRYTVSSGLPRRADEMHLTREICARLGCDLAAAHHAAVTPAP